MIPIISNQYYISYDICPYYNLTISHFRPSRQCTSENNAGLLTGVYKYIQNNTSAFESNFVFHRRQVDKLYLLHGKLNKSHGMTLKNSDWKYKYKSLFRVIYSVMWKSPVWMNFPRFVLNHISCFRIYIGMLSILKYRCRECTRIITRKCHLLVVWFLSCYSTLTLFLRVMAMYHIKLRKTMRYN